MKIVFVSLRVFANFSSRVPTIQREAIPNLPVVYLREVDTLIVLGDGSKQVTSLETSPRDADWRPSIHDMIEWIMDPERDWKAY